MKTEIEFYWNENYNSSELGTQSEIYRDTVKLIKHIFHANSYDSVRRNLNEIAVQSFTNE